MDSFDKRQIMEQLVKDKGMDTLLEETVERASFMMSAVIRVLKSRRTKVDISSDLESLAGRTAEMELICDQLEVLLGTEMVLEKKDRKLKRMETRAEFQRGDLSISKKSKNIKY